MTTTTVHGDTADDSVSSNSTVHATMLAGSNLELRGPTETSWITGQGFFSPTYYGRQGFFSFDTSSIPDTDTISAVVLSFVPIIHDFGGSHCVFEVYAYDWSTTVDTTDWRTTAQLGALTLLASYNSTSLVDEVRSEFTSETAFLSAINKIGTTRLMMTTNRVRAGTVPSAVEHAYWKSADVTGTTNDPQLVITHAAGETFTGYTRPQQSVYRM